MELERVHFEIFQRFEKSDKATKKKTKQESGVCLDPVATLWCGEQEKRTQNDDCSVGRKEVLRNVFTEHT